MSKIISLILLLILNFENVKSQTYMDTVSDLMFSFYHNTLSPLKSEVSECQFEPSCSHYSSEAISEFGFTKGIILTGDRLIRCSGGHLDKQDYPNSGKLLVDNPEANNVFGNGNLWKLTFNSSTNSNHNTLLVSNNKLLINDNLNADNIIILENKFEYPKELYSKKLYDNSIYELRRIEFFENDTLIKSRANLLIATNLLKQNKYNLARMQLDNYTKNDNFFDFDNIVIEYIINDLDNANNWNINKMSELTNNILLNRYVNLPPTDYNYYQYTFNKFKAYSFLKTDEVDSSKVYVNINQSLLNTYNTLDKVNNSDNTKILTFLDNYEKRSELSSSSAAIMSAIIPGLGYAYYGNVKEGLSSFIINGLLGLGIYSQFKSDNIGTGIFTSMVALPFYLGNIVGSYNTVENKNLKDKQILLNDYRNLLKINFYFSDDYFLSIFEK